jgi:hypothetical protein
MRELAEKDEAKERSVNELRTFYEEESQRMEERISEAKIANDKKYRKTVLEFEENIEQLKAIHEDQMENLQ